MQTTISTFPTAKQTLKPMLWAGRIMSALSVLFLTFDGTIKLFNIQPVVDASVLLGLPVDLAPILGLILLTCIAIYLIPRTSILGAILLTGYLGGAIAIQARIDAELFSLILPLILGAMIWGGLYLRNSQLRALLHLQLNLQR